MARRKKLGTFEIEIQKNIFPFEGYAEKDGKTYKIKNALAGQTVKAKAIKDRRDKVTAKVLELIKPADYEIESNCVHFPECGGCLMQSVDYKKQLEMIEEQVLDMFKENGFTDFEYEGIIESPEINNYRNKMEYTFGNEVKDGPLSLGLHPRGRFHDILNTFECNIAPKDFNIIQKFTQEYFLGKEIPFYNKYSHEGFLRHLLVRQGMKAKEIIIGLSTSTQLDYDFSEYIDGLLNLNIDGTIVGIMHVKNDRLADAIIPEKVDILYGRDYYVAEILGLKFNVSLFSFFQTNPLGAEVLYSKALSYISDVKNKVVYDLFSGTGTIGQIVAKDAKKVYGIELVEEAVKSANENAKLNDIDNCTFISGDVFEKLDELKEKPEVIILDPPRVGVHEKALKKIINYNIDEIVYISCNPKTFIENAKQLNEAGYKIKKMTLVDMFPHTSHVETVVRLCRK
ncbi:MAG: 23S rRNA (uracil(1939)-C(5))-methyltransferase RlmD [Clostridiales bacterium]|nr:23S rRNA (uracil(1939)-C(5))-methyltransferase RlmD [Clostridiales bacterium]